MNLTKYLPKKIGSYTIRKLIFSDCWIVCTEDARGVPTLGKIFRTELEALKFMGVFR